MNRPHSVLKQNLSRGFTLIELIVTLVVLGLIISVVVPRMLSMSEFYLDKATREIAGTVQFLFNRAVVKKTPYILRFDIDNGNYRILACREDAPVNASATDETSGLGFEKSAFPDKEKEKEEGPDKINLKVTIDGIEDELNVKGDCKPDDELDKSEYILPEGVSFRGVKLYHRDTITDRGSDIAVFFPNGFMTKLTVYLEDDNEFGSTIEINPLTGKFRIYDYLKDFETADKKAGKRDENN